MNRSKPYTNILFYLLCLFVLSACGGGGGGGSSEEGDGDKKSLSTQTLHYTTQDAITLTVGEELANPASGQGTGQVSYISSDANTVTVSAEGTLSALTQGTATITATIAEDETYAADSTSIEVTVNALAANTAPVITLIGQATMTLLQGTDYQEPGATATDNTDTEVTVYISGAVDNTVVGDYIITYSATDQAGNTSTVARTVTIREPKPFITTWKTDNAGTSGDYEIKIGTYGDGYNYQVNWGDGSSSENVNGDIIHTYDTTGTYTVSISGSFPQIYFKSENYDHSKILSIEQWGEIQWRSMSQAFAYCENLASNATDAPDLSQVTDMSYMFEGALAFNLDINNWDVSSVTNMTNMFFDAESFNQDISNWNVSSVKYISNMFSNAESFNQSLNKWDVSSVTNMTSMFSGATSFNQDISNWNVSSVKYISSMFSGATRFNQDISKWDVSSVTNMTNMFYLSLIHI